jgi:hypothetical protein
MEAVQNVNKHDQTRKWTSIERYDARFDIAKKTIKKVNYLNYKATKNLLNQVMQLTTETRKKP